jgi:hypothetical protein
VKVRAKNVTNFFCKNLLPVDSCPQNSTLKGHA